MNHLDEITLNEYLDDILDEPKRYAADLHLQSCAACRAILDELRSVFAEFDALPEVQLERDLTPSVLARLPQKNPVRVWTRAFAAQLGVAIGSMFWLGMQAIPFVRILQISVPDIPAMDIQALFARLLTLRLPKLDFQFPIFSYQLPTFNFQVPTLTLDFSPAQLITLSVSVVLLWVVGNFVLLRGKLEAR
mgnify:CR=1 FL=1